MTGGISATYLQMMERKQGWTCPRCNSCWSPTTAGCQKCNATPNLGGSFQNTVPLSAGQSGKPSTP